MRGVFSISYDRLLHGMKGITPLLSKGRCISTRDSSGFDNEANKGDDNEMQKKILDSALMFVPKSGWTKQAISEGAEAVGQLGVSHGLFPRGGMELVQHFYESCNEQLAIQLKKNVEEALADPTKQKEPLSFVKDAFKVRILMIAPYQKSWPQALGIMALPPNLPTALSCLLTLVDDVSYHAGDRSVNFEWYLHRMTLAGIYKATELHFTQDQSKEYQETWTFLARRVGEAAMMRDSLQFTSNVSRTAGEFSTAALTTVQNMLGLPFSRK